MTLKGVPYRMKWRSLQQISFEMSLELGSTILGTASYALRPRRFQYVHSRSLEASCNRVGIAERDDFVRVRCIVRTSRKGPVRARSIDRAASSGEGRSYARRAETS